MLQACVRVCVCVCVCVCTTQDAKVDQYAIRLFNVETKSVSASLGSQRQTPGKHNNTQNGDASNADHTVRNT